MSYKRFLAKTMDHHYHWLLTRQLFLILLQRRRLKRAQKQVWKKLKGRKVVMNLFVDTALYKDCLKFMCSQPDCLESLNDSPSFSLLAITLFWPFYYHLMWRSKCKPSFHRCLRQLPWSILKPWVNLSSSNRKCTVSVFTSSIFRHISCHCWVASLTSLLSL